MTADKFTPFDSIELDFSLSLAISKEGGYKFSHLGHSHLLISVRQTS